MQKISSEENQSFPKDPEAPKLDANKFLIDFLIFGLLSVTTFIIVSFSIYIIIIKYF